MKWREQFRTVFEGDLKWERYRYWENENYTGGEVEIVYAPSNKIEKLLDKIESLNPSLMKLIKEVYIIYHKGNEFRGGCPGRGEIIGDKEFLSRLIIEAEFKWIDKAWGYWWGTLRFDHAFLESMRDVQL